MTAKKSTGKDALPVQLTQAKMPVEPTGWKPMPQSKAGMPVPQWRRPSPAGGGIIRIVDRLTAFSTTCGKFMGETFFRLS